ncbi:hypothetical protein [Spirosoma linguale]
MKATKANIIRLWFGADTPIRDYQIKMNPALWKACVVVNETFIFPSGAVETGLYRRKDKLAFASTVQQVLLNRVD